MSEVQARPAADMATEQAALERTVEQMLAAAKAQGATQAEAGLSVDSGYSATARLGDVETIEHHRDRSVGVTVYFGHRKGSASTADFSIDAVRDTVTAACGIARYTSEDDCAGLADADCMATDIPDLDLCHAWDLDVEQAIALAIETEDAARATDPRISNSEGATVSSHQGLRVYGNSHGFLAGYPSSRHSLTCVVLAEHNGGMERDYWYTTARDASELEDARSVGRRAAERTVQRLDARQLSTRQAPVLYTPEVASGLIGHFVAAIRGSSQYRQSSFLLDAAGEQIFPDWLRMHEQPHLLRGPGSAPYDAEGVATRARDLVTDGVLQGYVLNSYSARKLGLQTTGNAGGVRNLTVDPGEQDFDGLLQAMGTGLVVTELMGQGINMVTGDYSRGAVGFWVEAGKIAYPVEQITVAGNLRDMYRQIVAVGSDVDKRGGIHTGSILIEQMTIAGD